MMPHRSSALLLIALSIPVVGASAVDVPVVPVSGTSAAVPVNAAIDGSPRYHLTFDDEFNTFDGTRWLTADFWGMRNNGGDYQGQWFCDPGFTAKDGALTAYNPFVVDQGVLSIVAQPTPPGIYSGPDKQPYVSGQLTSAHRFTQRYGYFEMRARVPAGKGLWSRFWLLTDDGIWPGEYDIFEIMGKDPLVTHQTTHFRDVQRNHVAYGEGYKGINPTDGQFHTYGFLWEPSGVTWYVDGVATLRQINRIDVPMYVLIDLVVGKDPGNLWPGNPDATNVWPVSLDLDYYRVYSNDPSLPGVVPEAGYVPSVLPNGFQVVEAPTTGPLPSGWKAGDIGTVTLPGSSTWNPGTGEWMLKGAGYGDQGQFAGKPLEGDGGIVATVTTASLINSNEIKAGVAFREGWGANDPEIALVYTVNYKAPKITHSIVLQTRVNGKTVELAKAKNTDAPATLRLQRIGNTWTGSYSTDLGRSWIPIGKPQVVDLPTVLHAGLVVRGNQDNYQRLSRATMTGVAVTAAP